MSHDDGDGTMNRHPKKLEQDQILGFLLPRHELTTRVPLSYFILATGLIGGLGEPGL